LIEIEAGNRSWNNKRTSIYVCIDENDASLTEIEAGLPVHNPASISVKHALFSSPCM